MIQGLGKRMEAKIEKMQEMFTEDLEEVKNKQTEMNNTLEGINNRITQAEDRYMTWRTEWWKSLSQSRKKNEKNEDSLRDLWDNIKHTNIHIIGAPEGEERKDLRKYLKR